MSKTKEIKAESKPRFFKRMKTWRLYKKILFGIFLLFLVSFLSLAAYATVVIMQAPKIDSTNINKILAQSTIVYDDKGNELTSLFKGENRTNIDYENIPQNMIDAVVSVEDKTFWEHHGFNFVRMAGAVFDAFKKGGNISGTSTITQQLARNVFLKQDKSKRTLKRKIIEAYYTVIIEKELSKKQIITAYLNTVFLGHDRYGIESAAQFYFGVDAKDMTLEQCVVLASTIQQPTYFSPIVLVTADQIKDGDRTYGDNVHGTYKLNDTGKTRRNYTLREMKNNGYISQAEYDAAINTPLEKILNPSTKTNNPYKSYFIDYLKKQLKDDLMEKYDYSEDEAEQLIYNGGLKVYSTIDLQAQGVLEKEFEIDSNFTNLERLKKDAYGNILNPNGTVKIYKTANYFDQNGNLKLTQNDAKMTDDGLLFYKNKKFGIVKTVTAGADDIALRFRTMYYTKNGHYYTIAGGDFYIAPEFKKLDGDGNLIISKDFLKANPNFLKDNGNGTYTISREYFLLAQDLIQPQAAMTIVENDTGYVKAMIGGRKAKGSMLLNRAVTPRQPGSAIKPLTVYGPALQQSLEEMEAGKKHEFKDYHIDKQGTNYWGDYITAGSVIMDEPTIIDGRKWPQNFNRSFSGYNTMRSSIVNSWNTTSVKTLLQVGYDYSIEMGKKFGLEHIKTEGTGNDRNLAALAVGGMSTGTSTLEMASAFTTFPNGGERHDTTCYTKVVDATGEELLNKEETKITKVLDAGVAWIMSDMLKDVIGPISPNTVAGGKSGTTDDYVIIWTCGFTPKYTAALYIASDYNDPMTTGSITAKNLWNKIMKQIVRANGGTYKAMPSNVINVDGEYFIKGTETGRVSKESIVGEEYEICLDSGYLATDACTNTEKRTYRSSDPNSTPPPKYYCDLHNNDHSKYPIDPALLPPDLSGENNDGNSSSGGGSSGNNPNNSGRN